MTKLPVALLGMILLPAWSSAEVKDSGANGFTVKVTLTIQAAAEQVYRSLVRNVGDWWDSEHTFSGDAHNLSIEEKPMGCFCEKLPSGGVRHLEVVNFVPGKTLVMTGGMGPLQSLATTASMTILFTPAPGGTKLEAPTPLAGMPLAASMR